MFAAFGRDLAEDLDAAYDRAPSTRTCSAEKVMVGCTHGMLLCLDREHRMAYPLGDVLGFSSEEAADLCDVAPAAFRKRPQRARERLQGFMAGHCGLLDPPTLRAAVGALKRDMQRFT